VSGALPRFAVSEGTKVFLRTRLVDPLIDYLT
jgi:hypothetical protein